MPAASPMVTPELTAAEYLLEQMLTSDGLERFRAHGELLNAKLGGLTIRDEACHDDHGRPVVMPISSLLAHLRRLDSTAAIEARDGIRLHTPANVRLGDREDGRGPALGMGGLSGGES